jgi:hypothetical protein
MTKDELLELEWVLKGLEDVRAGRVSPIPLTEIYGECNDDTDSH